VRLRIGGILWRGLSSLLSRDSARLFWFPPVGCPGDQNRL
jgi:hypothetical protein